MTTETIAVNVLTADALLKNWQGHRRLTRRTIDAFPEDKLFQFSLGGMRPFAEMAWEFIVMTVPIVEGVSTGRWEEYKGTKPSTKSEFFRLWDAQTVELDTKFPKIPEHRFSEIDKAFDKWEAPGLATIQYAIDNEIHHRGQGYVYLRALGIQPPPFWERELLRAKSNGCPPARNIDFGAAAVCPAVRNALSYGARTSTLTVAGIF